MLEAYSLNVSVGANSPIPFDNTVIKKGCTAQKSGSSSFELNKKGIYMVSFDGSATAVSTVQLYKDGVFQPQAQSMGSSLSFDTLVQVSEDNTPCCCTSPVTLQIMVPSPSTFSVANVNITKLC